MLTIWYDRFKYRIISLCYHFKTKKTRETSLMVKSMEGENVVSGTIFGKTMPRILRINSFYL